MSKAGGDLACCMATTYAAPVNRYDNNMTYVDIELGFVREL